MSVEATPSFGFVLHEAARLFSKRFDQRARRYGLTRAQCQVLGHLIRNEGINQAGLAEQLEMEPISLARLIDRMEQAGWVVRRPDPGDRRSRLLFTTDKTKPLYDQIARLGREVCDEALSGLPTEDGHRLIDLLLHVRGNLSQRALAPAPVADPVPQPQPLAGAVMKRLSTAGAR